MNMFFSENAKVAEKAERLAARVALLEKENRALREGKAELATVLRALAETLSTAKAQADEAADAATRP